MSAQRRNRDTTPDRRFHLGSIGVEIVEDLGARGESVRVRARIGKIGQPYRPIGKLETQAIPAFGPPAFADPPPFEHKVRTTTLRQHMAHDQTGLATANHQCLHMLGAHGGSPWFYLRCPTPRTCSPTLARRLTFCAGVLARGPGAPPLSSSPSIAIGIILLLPLATPWL